MPQSLRIVRFLKSKISKRSRITQKQRRKPTRTAEINFDAAKRRNNTT